MGIRNGTHNRPGLPWSRRVSMNGSDSTISSPQENNALVVNHFSEVSSSDLESSRRLDSFKQLSHIISFVLWDVSFGENNPVGVQKLRFRSFWCSFKLEIIGEPKSLHLVWGFMQLEAAVLWFWVEEKSILKGEISGELVTFELWGLENLEELDLEGNSFTGELPDEIVGLRNLRVLNLGLNELEGEVPASLSKFVDLEVLNLAGNKLKGSMSGYFGGFYKLKGLYLSNNQLNGPILENLDIIFCAFSVRIYGGSGKNGTRSLLLVSRMSGETGKVSCGVWREVRSERLCPCVVFTSAWDSGSLLELTPYGPRDGNHLRMDIRSNMERMVQKEVEDNANVLRWSEQSQLTNGDSVMPGYVSELFGYTHINVRQNDLSELKEIWGRWTLADKEMFYQFFGTRAYSCFTFGRVDLTPTIEEYQALVRCPRSQIDRIYTKLPITPSFKKKLLLMTGMSEDWVIRNIKKKGDSECISWVALKEVIDHHPDKKKKLDLFALGIYGLVIFPKKKNGWSSSRISEMEIFCGELRGIPLRIYFTDVESEIGFLCQDRILHSKEINIRVKLKGVAEAWKQTRRVNLFTYDLGLSQEYEQWRSGRVNDNILIVNPENIQPVEEQLRVVPSLLELAKRDFEAERRQWRMTLQKLEDEVYQKGLEIDIQKSRADRIEKVASLKRVAGESQEELKQSRHQVKILSKEKDSLEQQLQKSQAQNEKLKEKISSLEIALRRYRSGEGSSSRREVESLKKQVSELEAMVRDFQRQTRHARRIAQYLVILSEEAADVTEELDPEAEENQKIVELLSHHTYRTRKKVMEDKLAQIEKAQLELQDNIKKMQEDMINAQKEMFAKFASMLEGRNPEHGKSPMPEGVTEGPLHHPGLTPEQSQNVQVTPVHVGKVHINPVGASVNVQPGSSSYQEEHQYHQVLDLDEEAKKDQNNLLEEKWKQLEREVRAMKEDTIVYGFDAKELSLVPDLVLPPKFKIPDFEKFDGTRCPSAHITMFCRKITRYIGDDQLLIHCFQESLTGSAIRWYTTGEMIEMAIKSGKLEGGESSKRPPTRKKESEILYDRHVVSPYHVTPMQPPFPKWYDASAQCEYHAGNPEHSIENCTTFKKVVQALRTRNVINFGDSEQPNSSESVTKPCRGRMVKVGLLKPSLRGEQFNSGEVCQYHNSEGHSIQQCPDFLSLVQDMIDSKEIEFLREIVEEEEAEVCASEGSAKGMRWDALLEAVGVILLIPKESEKKVAVDKGKKVDVQIEEDKPVINEPVTESESVEFLKFLKHSEYSVVEQLHKLLAHEIPSGMIGSQKALHITVKCKGYVLSRVLVDNGSALNVMLLVTLKKLPLDSTLMRTCQSVVRAFDETKREVLGKIDVPLNIGPATYEAGAVSFTLHQRLKFVIDGRLVCIHAEEDIIASVSTTAPYIEVDEQAVESKVGKGLGRQLQGPVNPICPVAKKDRFGLGYQPTPRDKLRGIKKGQEMRKARLAGEDLSWEPMIFPSLSNIFISGGHMFQGNSRNIEVMVEDALRDLGINVITDGEFEEMRAMGIYPAPPGFVLNNWTAEELPVVYKSFTE
ncbi:hypothetical protein F3Y22_tig00110156pilonHSYRG00408 [Hibiscus syriacus]|uniref:DUF7745 domain-containing protein n=1 Tax=Hibiscus syriacus TaxID=106335 RepID=A0A6A3BJA8_HIBSY|nr:hypothetical protein F3Y22_tig00110156pilonHSYRG00408 [Hibiscus syriacus]